MMDGSAGLRTVLRVWVGQNDAGAKVGVGRLGLSGRLKIRVKRSLTRCNDARHLPSGPRIWSVYLVAGGFLMGRIRLQMSTPGSFLRCTDGWRSTGGA